MRAFAVLGILLGLTTLGCRHSADNRLNAPRCVTDIECGQDQHCEKTGHHVDGVCMRGK